MVFSRNDDDDDVKIRNYVAVVVAVVVVAVYEVLLELKWWRVQDPLLLEFHYVGA